MLYVLLFSVIAFAFSSLAYLVIELRSTAVNIGEDPDETEKDEKTTVEKRGLSFYLSRMISCYKSFTLKKWLIVMLSVAGVAFIVARYVLYSADAIATVKIAVSAVILSSAGIVDLHTKKIPNFYPILLLAVRAILLVCEFVWQRSAFKSQLIWTVVSFFVAFLVMLLFALLTRGGFGMGDVKLLSCVCAHVGILSTLYTLTLGMFVCMLVSLVLLAFKKKTMIFSPLSYGDSISRLPTI